MAAQVPSEGSSRTCTPEGQRLPAPTSPPPLRRKVSPVPYCAASAPRSLAVLLAGWPAGPEPIIHPKYAPTPSMTGAPEWALAARAAVPLRAGGPARYGAPQWPVAGELPPAAASAAAARLLGAHSRCGTGAPQANVMCLSLSSWTLSQSFYWDLYVCLAVGFLRSDRFLRGLAV